MAQEALDAFRVANQSPQLHATPALGALFHVYAEGQAQ
jgi:hypothetical protein